MGDLLLKDGGVLELATGIYKATKSGNPWHNPRTGQFANAPPGVNVIRGLKDLGETDSPTKQFIDDRRKVTNPDAMAAATEGDKLHVLFFRQGALVDNFEVAKQLGASPVGVPRQPEVGVPRVGASTQQEPQPADHMDVSPESDRASAVTDALNSLYPWMADKREPIDRTPVEADTITYSDPKTGDWAKGNPEQIRPTIRLKGGGNNTDYGHIIDQLDKAPYEEGAINHVQVDVSQYPGIKSAVIGQDLENVMRAQQGEGEPWRWMNVTYHDGATETFSYEQNHDMAWVGADLENADRTGRTQHSSPAAPAEPTAVTPTERPVVATTPAMEFPRRITKRWMETVLPTLNAEQAKAAIDRLRASGWGDKTDSLPSRVYPHLSQDVRDQLGIKLPGQAGGPALAAPGPDRWQGIDFPDELKQHVFPDELRALRIAQDRIDEHVKGPYLAYKPHSVREAELIQGMVLRHARYRAEVAAPLEETVDEFRTKNPEWNAPAASKALGKLIGYANPAPGRSRQMSTGYLKEFLQSVIDANVQGRARQALEGMKLKKNMHAYGTTSMTGEIDLNREHMDKLERWLVHGTALVGTPTEPGPGPNRTEINALAFDALRTVIHEGGHLSMDEQQRFMRMASSNGFGSPEWFLEEALTEAHARIRTQRLLQEHGIRSVTRGGLAPISIDSVDNPLIPTPGGSQSYAENVDWINGAYYEPLSRGLAEHFGIAQQDAMYMANDLTQRLVYESSGDTQERLRLMDGLLRKYGHEAGLDTRTNDLAATTLADSKADQFEKLPLPGDSSTATADARSINAINNQLEQLQNQLVRTDPHGREREALLQQMADIRRRLDTKRALLRAQRIEQDFTEYPGFKVTVLPQSRSLTPAATRKRHARMAATGKGFQARSVTKPHQHHLLTPVRKEEDAPAVPADIAATDPKGLLSGVDWVEPPEPEGIHRGRGGAGGYTSDNFESTLTQSGRIAEQAVLDLTGGELLHPAGKGEQSPLDVSYGGYGFEVKGNWSTATSFKATPKPHEVSAKEAAAEALGLNPALCIVVMDRRNGVAHVYWRPGLKGGKLAQSTGWRFMGTVPLPARTPRVVR